MPELIDIRQYVRTLPTNTLMGFGAFAALTTFWYATRPKALKPPCDLSMQSVEVAVSGGGGGPACLVDFRFVCSEEFNLIDVSLRTVSKEKLLVANPCRSQVNYRAGPGNR